MSASALIAAIAIASTAPAAELSIGSAAGYPGDEVFFSVALTASHLGCIHEFDQTIGFDPRTRVARQLLAPRCRGLDFGRLYDGGCYFSPVGCTADLDSCTGASLTGVLKNTEFPENNDGGALFGFFVEILRGTEPGLYPLTCEHQTARNCNRRETIELECTPGTIQVLDCPGDCDRDGATTIDELIRGVAIALDVAPVDACLAMDSDRNGSIRVDELMRGVGGLLDGCRADD
jgi:hypothetical protein